MVECLLSAEVDFMLVGGYAVALHGWPRTTFDIDFWIMANPENAKSVLQAIKSFGAPLMDLTEEDFHKPGMVFQIGTEPQRIDIVSAIDGLEYSEAAKHAVKMNVDGLEIKPDGLFLVAGVVDGYGTLLAIQFLDVFHKDETLPYFVSNVCLQMQRILVERDEV